MRAVIQRVSSARVLVDGEVVGEIGAGLLILLGVARDEPVSAVDYIAKKIAELRIFEDDNQKMNRSIKDINGSCLIVSQFTLYADCRKGRRPSFTQAAPPDLAEQRYKELIESIGDLGIPVSTGVFRANMQVELVNDGPVTVILENE